MEKTIEIPFGAKDSELNGWEYTIPENMEAEIKDGKIIVREKENEDEKIRKQIIGFFSGRYALCNINTKDAIAYLERQKYKENYDRMAPIYEEKESFESALGKAWKFYNESASATVDGLEDNSRELTFAKGFREGFIYKERQKEQMSHLELKAGKWYICHRAFCARADHLTVKEGERFQCEKDGIVKGFVIKEPERYFKECSAPEPMEKEQKPAERSEKEERLMKALQTSNARIAELVEENYNLKETKQEWSEEDKEMLRIISNRLEKFNEWATEQGYPIDDPTMKQSPIDWLKSLRTHPHWKPSEEQMEALSDAYVEARTFKMADILESLHQDLEKL